MCEKGADESPGKYSQSRVSGYVDCNVVDGEPRSPVWSEDATTERRGAGRLQHSSHGHFDIAWASDRIHVFDGYHQVRPEEELRGSGGECNWYRVCPHRRTACGRWCKGA